MDCIDQNCTYAAPLQVKLRLRLEVEGQSKPFYSEEEIFMGEHNYVLVKIPPKIINGFKNIGTKECIVANCSSVPHDKSEIIRYSPYDNAFDYNWDIVFK